MTYKFSSVTVRLLIRPGIGREDFDESAQPLLLFPQDTERDVCEGFTAQGEGERAPGTSRDQLLDDTPKHLVDLEWVAGHLSSCNTRGYSASRWCSRGTRSGPCCLESD